jgi:uncharacterized protein YacL (UPF0231 family)
MGKQTGGRCLMVYDSDRKHVAPNEAEMRRIGREITILMEMDHVIMMKRMLWV